MKQKPKAEAEMLPRSGISPVENSASFPLISYFQAALKCCFVLMVSVTHHGAAEGPKPPEQSQGQQQEEDEQGDGQDGPVRLEGNTENVRHLGQRFPHTDPPVHPAPCPSGPSPFIATFMMIINVTLL